MTTMAGVPRMAGTAWVPAHLVTSPDAYVSQVMDDGMLGAGVHEGDLVLVDPDRAPEDGNIVVAMVTWNNARCRVIRWYRAGGLVLESANCMYPAMNLGPDADLQVAGVVVRSFNPATAGEEVWLRD